MNKKKYRKLFPFFLGLFVISTVFFIKIYRFHQNFTSKFNPAELNYLYQNSQFSLNPDDQKFIIRDQDLYAYAGWFYLTTGKIETINIEHPPLGKYLIGLSILIFDNQNLIQIPFGLAFLCLSFLLAQKILKNIYLAVLVPLGLLFEKLFIQQITLSLLDLFQATMIILFILLAMSAKTKFKIVLLGLVLGSVASIKFPITPIILGISYFIYLYFLREKNKIFKTFIILVIGICFYLSIYAPVLIQNSPQGFIDLQIKALKIHLSHLPNYPKFVPLRIMVLNQWPVWWDFQSPIHKVEERNFFWFFFAFSTIISPLFYKNISKNNLLFFLFSWSYFIFINFRLFFPTYLFLLLPFLYIILFWELKLIFISLKRR